MENQQHFDYIIAGAGLAGLTLAWQMLENDLLTDKTVLLIDADQKSSNDRTWCFWSVETPWLHELPISQKWTHAKLLSNNLNKRESLTPYAYYKIEGIDYYQFIFSKIKQSKNIKFVNALIENQHAEKQLIQTSKGDYYFKEYCFKSHFWPDELVTGSQNKQHFLWQHFLGWKISVDKKAFHTDTITYMDMRVPAVGKGLSFAYILPESENTALVEFTLFSPDLWQKEQYKEALQDYLTHQLEITEYEIIEEEYNKIPMTNKIFDARKKNIIPIGTLAGTVKPSTGYSFMRNYYHIQKIIKALKSAKNDFSVSSKRRFRFYDEVLMNVMLTEKCGGQEVFEKLYQGNRLPLLLKFLNEDTNLWEELKIMNTVPKWPFITAVGEELWK